MNGKADASFLMAPEDMRRRERKSIRRRMTSRGIRILVVAVLLQVSGNARAQLVSPVKVEFLQRFKEFIYLLSFHPASASSAQIKAPRSPLGCGK
jgi:hypothetical protein